jgi:hypothetical protein
MLLYTDIITYMVKYSKKLIEEIRRYIVGKRGKIIGKPYKKIYKDKKVNHITMEYIEDGKIKYRIVPEYVANRAVEIQKQKKWEPLTQRQDVTYRNKHPIQKMFHGKFTMEEIRTYANKLSAEKASKGQKGLMEVSVPEWDYERRGNWRTSKVKKYGEPVEFMTRYDGSELPESFNSFAIYEINL